MKIKLQNNYIRKLEYICKVNKIGMDELIVAIVEHGQQQDKEILDEIGVPESSKYVHLKIPNDVDLGQKKSEIMRRYIFNFLKANIEFKTEKCSDILLQTLKNTPQIKEILEVIGDEITHAEIYKNRNREEITALLNTLIRNRVIKKIKRGRRYVYVSLV